MPKTLTQHQRKRARMDAKAHLWSKTQPLHRAGEVHRTALNRTIADEIDAICRGRIPAATMYRVAEALDLAWSMGCDHGARCAIGRPAAHPLRPYDSDEIAALIVRLHQHQDTVTEPDLIRAGVSPAALEEHRDEATAKAAQIMTDREAARAA